MAHGGPDDAGYYSQDGLHLGHRRLSILDLSAAGHQPMQYRGITISYNGEIYNFRELKADLQSRGHLFKTATDTEVILAAYAEWGMTAFEKLEGMFAFALHDPARKKLLLVRDSVGIKPCYYFHSKNGFAFSSEIKACLLYTSPSPRD